MSDYFQMMQDAMEIQRAEALRGLLIPSSLPAVGEAGGAETIPLAPSAEPTGTVFLGGRI